MDRRASHTARILGVSLIALTLVHAVAEAEEQDAAGRTRALVATLTKASGGEGEKALGLVDDYFDFDGITTQALAPRSDKLTSAERDEMRNRLRRIVRRAGALDAGAFFRKAKLTYGAVRSEGDSTVVPVHAEVPADDVDAVVELRWRQVGGKLRIVDVAFDGDSLVKDYQNQIARLFDKEGAAGILKKLDEREAAVAAKGAKKK